MGLSIARTASITPMGNMAANIALTARAILTVPILQ